MVYDKLELTSVNTTLYVLFTFWMTDIFVSFTDIFFKNFETANSIIWVAIIDDQFFVIHFASVIVVGALTNGDGKHVQSPNFCPKANVDSKTLLDKLRVL